MPGLRRGGALQGFRRLRSLDGDPDARRLMPGSPNGLVRVLVVMAHPDDAEFGAAATVARWANEGRQATYLILTDGNRGSSDPAMTAERPAQIRHAEQRAAAMQRGVKDA